MHNPRVAEQSAEDAPTDPDDVRVPLIPADELRRYEGLFLLLCRLRAASAAALWRLYLLPALGIGSRQAGGRVTDRLRAAGYLNHLRLSAYRSVYYPTHRALVSFPSVRARATAAMRKIQSGTQAHFFWLRANLHAALVEEGFTVGRGPRELAALRRFYLDEQTAALRSDGHNAERRRSLEEALVTLRADEHMKPPFSARCSRCGALGPMNLWRERCSACGGSTVLFIPPRVYRCRVCSARRMDLPDAQTHVAGGHASGARECAGAYREEDACPIDVAWRKDGARYVVRGVFVDEPRRSLVSQLGEIPAQILHLPRLPLIVRSCDQRSYFDARAGRWAALGPRHAALLRALTDDDRGSPFPFSLTVSVIDFRPELQLWTNRAAVRRSLEQDTSPAT